MGTAWQFDQETAVAADPGDSSAGHGRWTTDISAEWNIGANPNGGYILTSSLRAMAQGVGPDDVPLSMTTHFLRPAVGAAPARITVEPVKRGRRISVFRSAMAQAEHGGSSPEKRRIVSMASFGSLGEPPDSDADIETGARVDMAPSAPAGSVDEIRPDDIPAPDGCLDRSDLPQGVELPIMSRLDVRLDPATSATHPDSSGPAAMRGWIRFADGRPCDVMSLPLFADSFPPSLFSRFGRIGWVPTVELTVHVRARPKPGWIQAAFETHDLRNGTIIEDGLLWDCDGQMVARSRQLAVLL